MKMSFVAIRVEFLQKLKNWTYGVVENLQLEYFNIYEIKYIELYILEFCIYIYNSKSKLKTKNEFLFVNSVLDFLIILIHKC